MLSPSCELIAAAEKVLAQLSPAQGPVTVESVQALRTALEDNDKRGHAQFGPLLHDLRRAATFQKNVDRACADGEDVMSTGVLRDAIEWSGRSRKAMCDWLLSVYPEEG